MTTVTLANPVSGTQLNIGPYGPTNTISVGPFSLGGSGAIGDYNIVLSDVSFAVGYGHEVSGSTCDFVAGDGNQLLVTGGFGGSESNAMFGISNLGNNLMACLVAGTLNDVDAATDSAAIGHGLILSAGTQSQIVVGQYNAPAAANARFIVATGTDSDPQYRKNAFMVYDNGSADLGGQPVVTASTFQTHLGDANFALTSINHRSITVNASSSGPGKNLTIQAGNPANGNNLAGGSLILSGGNSTGNGGSSIEFRTAVGGTSGNGIATPMIRMKINAAGGIDAGEGLSALAAPQFVLGRYNNDAQNDTTTTPATDHRLGVFIIGAGETAARKNAMRVLVDGTILVQPQGDLIMDTTFQVGPTP